MNMKDAFRFQNKLKGLMCEATAMAAFQPVFPVRKADDPFRMLLIKFPIILSHFSVRDLIICLSTVQMEYWRIKISGKHCPCVLTDRHCVIVLLEEGRLLHGHFRLL